MLISYYPEMDHPLSGVYIFKIYAWCGKWNGNFNQTVLIDCSIARTGFLEDRL